MWLILVPQPCDRQVSVKLIRSEQTDTKVNTRNVHTYITYIHTQTCERASRHMRGNLPSQSGLSCSVFNRAPTRSHYKVRGPLCSVPLCKYSPQMTACGSKTCNFPRSFQSDWLAGWLLGCRLRLSHQSNRCHRRRVQPGPAGRRPVVSATTTSARSLGSAEGS